MAASANCFEYYANLTGHIGGETIPMNGPLFDYTLREPIGVCAQIIPWNFPLLMAAWKLCPALATGNTIILKPASATPITAVLLGQICLEAGIPDGVVNVLTGPGAEIGAALAEHPDVDKVAFTGETETGRQILRLSASTIKKVSLELGGKSPNIVFPDADIEEAVNGSLFAIFTNAGQRCTARTRLFLHESIHDRFMSDFVKKAGQIRVGDPMEDATQMGPVISPRQCERVLSFVERARGEGAELSLGGKRPDVDALRSGNFVEPTIFDQVHNDMTIAQEEVFGPVLSVIPFKDDAEVVRMANNVIYGLAATIWTNDIKRAHRLAGEIRAGNVSINYPDSQSAGSAVRRLQAERHRSRAGAPCARPLHAGQERGREFERPTVRLVRKLANRSITCWAFRGESTYSDSRGRLAGLNTGPTGRVAVVDLGSNSGRLVVFDQYGTGYLNIVEDARVPLRLASDLQRDGRLGDDATARTIDALHEFHSIARGAGADRLIVVGTASMREASNGDAFLHAIQQAAGLPVEILDGESEARYSFMGAIHGLPVWNGYVLDIGGGSLELTKFRDRGHICLVDAPTRCAAHDERIHQERSADQQGGAQPETAPEERLG